LYRCFNPLRRDHLAWVGQELCDDTLIEANAKLVAVQNSLKLARMWGEGELASADGLRFVVLIKIIHAGTNQKYFGVGKGVTYYLIMLRIRD
jgi:TnpA family transposase